MRLRHAASLFCLVLAGAASPQLYTRWSHTYSSSTPYAYAGRGVVFGPNNQTWATVRTVLSGEPVFGILKYQAAGSVGETFHNQREIDEPLAIVLDAAGNPYIAGYSHAGGSLEVSSVISANAITGNERISAWLELARMHALVGDQSGNVYAAGAYGPAHESDFVVQKFNHVASLEWTSYWNRAGKRDEATCVVQALGSPLYAAGSSQSATGDTDFQLVCYNGNGTIAWARSLDGGNGVDIVRACAAGPNGSVYLVGESQNAHGDTDVLCAKYDSSGNLLWSHRYDGAGSGNDGATSVAYVPGQGIAVGGFTYGGAATGEDMLVLRYDESGQLLWARSVSGVSSGADRAQNVFVDRGGNVYLAGTSCAPFLSGHDYMAVRFTRTGFELWRNSWDNVGADDIVDDVAFDGINRLALTGAAGMQAGTVIMIDPGVTPHTLNLVQGAITNGALDDVLIQDSRRLRMIPSTSQAVGIELTGTVPLDSVDELRVRLGAKSNSLAVVQRIELFDFTAGGYVQVDVRGATQTDNAFEVVVPQQQRFVETGTGKIQAKVTWTSPTSNRFDARWFVECNSFQWKIKRAALE